MAYSYLIWLLCFFIFPAALLWAVFGSTLWRYRKAVALAPLGSLLFSIPWDIISVREHIWYFQKPFIAGLWIGELPIEEYFFIISVSVLFASISALLYDRNGIAA
ncbi:MAG: lycopene cyclase domain-containing protein [Patescibacteria group bacterium]|nr:lycopene cyclase domain-containing protein [Patescibacteria group bacterium]